MLLCLQDNRAVDVTANIELGGTTGDRTHVENDIQCLESDALTARPFICGVLLDFIIKMCCLMFKSDELTLAEFLLKDFV